MPDFDDVVLFSIGGRDVTLAMALQSARTHENLDFISKAISSAVIDQVIGREGITVDDAELQREADLFRRARKLFSVRETQAWIKERGLSAEDLESRLERAVALRQLEAAIPEAEVERYFVENRKRFERAKLSQIVVASREAAEELQVQVEDEEADFRSLAIRHSTDTASNEAGGFLGWVNRTTLSPQVEALVFSAEADSMVGPVQTDAGWHLIMVWEIVTGTLDEAVGGEIRSTLLRQRLDAETRKARAEVNGP